MAKRRQFRGPTTLNSPSVCCFVWGWWHWQYNPMLMPSISRYDFFSGTLGESCKALMQGKPESVFRLVCFTCSCPHILYHTHTHTHLWTWNLLKLSVQHSLTMQGGLEAQVTGQSYSQLVFPCKSIYWVSSNLGAEYDQMFVVALGFINQCVKFRYL